MVGLAKYFDFSQTKITNTGSKYGTIAAILGQGLYSVNISGKLVTAQSKIGAISKDNAVIVQQTGTGYFIISDLGMSGKAATVVFI